MGLTSSLSGVFGKATSNRSSFATALHELREHLLRSRGWGNTLETLLITAKRPNASRDEVEIALKRFLNDGYNVAHQLYYNLRRCGQVWKRLEMHVRMIHEYWMELQQTVKNLEKTLRTSPLGQVGVRDAEEKLEMSREKFLSCLDYIAVRPGPAIEELRQLAPSMAVLSSNSFSVEVDKKCPSIAMLKQDFQECVCELLTNAQDHSNGMTNVTIFRFSAAEGAFSKILLQISQSVPWKRSTRLEGGLYRVRTLCSTYGASIKVRPEATPGEAFLEIRFLSWPIYEDVEPAGRGMVGL